MFLLHNFDRLDLFTERILFFLSLEKVTLWRDWGKFEHAFFISLAFQDSYTTWDRNVDLSQRNAHHILGLNQQIRDAMGFKIIIGILYFGERVVLLEKFNKIVIFFDGPMFKSTFIIG